MTGSELDTFYEALQAPLRDSHDLIPSLLELLLRTDQRVLHELMDRVELPVFIARTRGFPSVSSLRADIDYAGAPLSLSPPPAPLPVQFELSQQRFFTRLEELTRPRHERYLFFEEGSSIRISAVERVYDDALDAALAARFPSYRPRPVFERRAVGTIVFDGALHLDYEESAADVTPFPTVSRSWLALRELPEYCFPVETYRSFFSSLYPRVSFESSGRATRVLLDDCIIGNYHSFHATKFYVFNSSFVSLPPKITGFDVELEGRAIPDKRFFTRCQKACAALPPQRQLI